MKYDIYFHNDFDGAASAAVLLNFLRSRGDDFSGYKTVNFPAPLNWADSKFRNPTIIVDFLYHPKANFWFDHHSTAFLKSDWKKNFRQTKFRHWDPSYKSCCHLVLDRLIKDFDFKPPKYFQELANWLDKIDGAVYSSVEEAMGIKLPAIQIGLSFEKRYQKEKNINYFKEVIEALSRQSFKEVAKLPSVQVRFKEYEKSFQSSLDFFKKNLILYQETAFIDESVQDVLRLRYAAYHFYPKIFYCVELLKHNKEFSVGVGSNPWRRPTGKVHIGDLLRKHYGGGGHQSVGRADFKTKNDALKAAEEVIKILNKYEYEDEKSK